MVKVPTRSFALLAVATLITAQAFAASAVAKESKKAEIAALEEQIHDLRSQEKAVLQGIDEHFEYIIRSIDPDEVHHQLVEILAVLRRVKEDLGHRDDLDYGGNRGRANESIEKADVQVERALKHDTAEERAKAAHDMGAVREDLGKALTYSIEHPEAGKGKDELERRAVENQKLEDALHKIALAHHVLEAVDHEIADYKAEKNDLHKRRDAEMRETKERFGEKVKQLEERIKALKK